MPHRRSRHVTPLLIKLMGMSPIVGILGHRQVGKTTLLELLAKHYYTMDESSELLEAEKDPKEYIQQRSGLKVAVDECQLAPSLFPALKEWVRTHPRPGQFLLSGSVRFTSRKAIQESLTGRIVNLELLPMLLSELLSTDLPNFWRRTISTEEFSASPTSDRNDKKKREAILRYFEQGGLPGICFIREEKFRERKLDTQIETILDRDLRKVVPTNIVYPQLRRLLQGLADRQGEPFSWSELKKETEISIPTLKKLFYGLESVFLIRTILVEGDVGGPVNYFEDLAELKFVRNKPQAVSDQIIHFLMIHMRGEMSYGSSAPFRIFQFRTRAGVCIPLALQVKQDFVGVIALEGESPTRSEMAAADSFLKRYYRSKVVMVHWGSHAERVSSRKAIIPLFETV